MKIRDVKTYVLEAPLAEPFAYSQAWYERRGACLVEIVGEDGTSGWGEAFGPAAADRADRRLLQAIAGRRRRARDRGDLAEPLQPAARPRPEGAGDRGAERRRHRAVGPEGPPSRPAGAPAAGRPAAHPGRGLRHRLLPQARTATRSPIWSRRRTGASPRASPASSSSSASASTSDVAACAEAVRRAVGDELRIMVDANHAYDATAAIRLGRGIEALDIAWFEEPVPPEDLAGYREVKAALSDPDRRRRGRVHPLGLPAADRRAAGRHPAARCVRRRRHLGVQEDRRHGECLRGAGQPACLGHRGRARRLVAADRGIAAQPARPPPDRAAARIRLLRAPAAHGGGPEPIEQRDGWVEVPAGPGPRHRDRPHRPRPVRRISVGTTSTIVIPGRRAAASPKSIFQRSVFMDSGSASFGRAPE